MIYTEQQYPAAVVNPVYPQQSLQQAAFAAPTAALNVPPAMPAGWAAHWDQGQQKYYYHNISTGAVTWEPRKFYFVLFSYHPSFLGIIVQVPVAFPPAHCIQVFLNI